MFAEAIPESTCSTNVRLDLSRPSGFQVAL